MQPLPAFPAGLIVSNRLAAVFIALIFLNAQSLRADAPATALRIAKTGPNLEGLPTFKLEWNAISNATYLVQSASSLAPGSPWKTLDAVVPTAGTYVFDLVATDDIGLSSQPKFYRLILPQPEIFSVEPAVVAPGTVVDMYVVGQCFSSNDVLRINGVTQSNVVFNSSTLLTKPTFTPGAPGTYVVQLVVSGLVRSSFTLTCADAFSNPERVLQGPPEQPPASPSRPVGRITFKAKEGATLARGLIDGIRENDNVVFEVQEGKKGLNAVNVKLARMAGGDGVAQSCGTEIVAHSGEVRQQAVDLVIPGRGLDFIWQRTYNSRIGRTGASINGWTFSYDIHLQPLGGDFVIHDGTGRADQFKPGTNGIYTCPEFFREGTLTGGVFRLTFADTGYWEFKPLTASADAGKLSQIVDRNGNTVTLNYDGGGRLTQVVDDLDRTNTVAYNLAGQIESVTDFSGRTVRYEYDTHGDLVACVSPVVTGTPNGNDFSGGKTNSYTYSSGYLDDRENHLLLTVKDANGTIKHEYIYQHNQTNLEFLRCISIQRWTNPPTILTYLAQTPSPSNQFAALRCIINGPVGNVAECFYDARNRLLKLEEFTGRAAPGVPVTATVNRPTGKLRASDPDSYTTQWSWNNDSLCTRVLMPRGDHAARVYESDFDKTTPPRKRGDLRVLRELPCCGGADTDGDGENDLTVRTWQFTHDSHFGTSEDQNLLGLKEYNPTKEYLVGDSVIYNNMRSRLDALESKLQAFGLLARGPRQSTSLDGSQLGSAYIDNPEIFICPSSIDDFVTSATDPRGHVTTASYDANGNRVKVKFPWLSSGEETSWARNSHGEVIGVTNAPDANGHRRYDDYEKNYGFTVQRIIDAGPGGLQLTNKFERDVRGNITRFVDARGNDWLYTYNSLDQCVRAQTPTNLTTRSATDFSYDENNNLFTVSGTVRDAFDNPLPSKTDQFRHDPLHRLTRVECAVDASHSLTNDFVYDGNGQCVLALGPAAVSGADPHQTVSFQYDERRLLFRQTGASGSTIQTTTQLDYDSNGNPIRVSVGLEGTPSTTTFEHDGFAGFGYSSSKINGGSLVALQQWTTAQHVRGSGVTQLPATSTGLRFSKVTDPMGNVTTFNYDANDNLKVVRHFGQTNDVAGTNGNIRLAESRYEYNALDQLVRSRDLFFNPATQTPIGDGERTTTCTYAPNGQCVSVSDDLGRTTTFAYDTAGWPSSVTSPGAKTIVVCLRDQAGNVTSCAQTDHSDLGGAPQVFSWTSVFDSLGRCVSTTDNVGNNNNWSFDSLSRVVKTTDPRGKHSFYEYDLLGRRTIWLSDLDGDGMPSPDDISSSAYWTDANPRWPATTTDSHGNTTTHNFDSLGRVTQIMQADGTHRSLIWSPRSNLTSEQDANGTVALHTYDLNNRCISNSYTPGPNVAATTTFEQYAYDGLSRLVGATNDVSHSGMEYDSLGNNPGNHRDGWNVLSAFNSVGNRTALTYPGGRALTYAYDALDQCTNIVESGASLVSLEYDGPGRVARVSYGNGMRTRIFYDGLVGVPNASGDFGHGQISHIRHALAGGSPIVSEVSLAWDRNGNKIKRDDAIFAPAIPRTNVMTLTYDNADRLVDSIVMSGSVPTGFATYGLDRMGNRTNINRPFCAGNYFMDALVPGPLDFQMNQYTMTPCDSRSYDEKGNLVGRGAGPGSFVGYVYDCHNRLVSVNDSGNPVAAYSYNALGQRISKTVFDSGGLPPVTTEFVYDGGEVIEERVNNSVTATYLRLGPANGGVERGGFGSMRLGGQDYFFHTDDQGNVLALTTTGGAVAERYDYDDYGKVTFLTSDGIPTSANSSSVGNVYCWGGLRLDAETGLHNNDGGGYFEPQSGRTYTGIKRRLASDRERFGGLCASPGGNNPWSGGGAFSQKNRTDLKEEFKNGDIPSENDFADTIDSALNLVDDGLTDYSLSGKVPRSVLKEYFQTGDKPTQPQFSTLIDSLINRIDDRNLLGLRTYDTRSCPGGGRVWPHAGYWSASGRASKDMVLKGKKILQN